MKERSKGRFKRWSLHLVKSAWCLTAWISLVAILLAVGCLGWILLRADVPSFDTEAIGKNPWRKLADHLLEHHTTTLGTPITVNNSGVVYEADVSKPGDTIYTNFSDAVAAARDRGDTVLPSVDLIHASCKAFNDELVWTVERWLQSERKPMNKAEALQRLLKRLDDRQAYLYVATATHLGGAPADERLGLADTIRQRATAFTSGKLRPLGAWNDSEAQRRIFWQDRYLMARFDMPAEHRVLGQSRQHLVEAIASDPELDRFFRFMDRLDAARTNPAESKGTYTALAADLEAAKDQIPVQLVAARSSPEARLFRLVKFQNSEEFAEGLSRMIRSGRLSLEPAENAGWYDHQLHALETLLLPDRAHESRKFILSDSYKEHLLESFKAAFTADRETHVKLLYRPWLVTSLKSAKPKPERVTLTPSFPVEPTATVYLRIATAYHVLHRHLSQVDGLDADMLADIHNRAELLYGITDLLQPHLGHVRTLEDEAFDRESARERAAAWLANWPEDPWLKPDVRTAIPMTEMEFTGRVQHFAIAGVALTPATYNWHESAEPLVRRIDGHDGEFPIKAKFAPLKVHLPTRVFVDFVNEGALVTREDFRKQIDGLGLADIRNTYPADGSARFANGRQLPPLRALALPLIAIVLPLFVVVGVLKRSMNWVVTRGIGLICIVVLIALLFPAVKWRILLNASASHHVLATQIDHQAGWRSRHGERDVKALVGMLDSSDPQVAYLASATLSADGIPTRSFLSPHLVDKIAEVIKSTQNNAMKHDLLFVLAENCLDQLARETVRQVYDANVGEMRRAAGVALAQFAHPDDQDVLLRGFGKQTAQERESIAYRYPNRKTALALLDGPSRANDEYYSTWQIICRLLAKNPEALSDTEKNERLPSLVEECLKQEEPRGFNANKLKHIPDPAIRQDLEDLSLAHEFFEDKRVHLIESILYSDQGAFERLEPILRRIADTGNSYERKRAKRLLDEHTEAEEK